MPALIVALLGAESTGKTHLATALTQTLIERGHRTGLVLEYLREFCDQHQRVPSADEQVHIAAEQTRRIQTQAAVQDVVIADTTALMTAVYSHQVFGDVSLYPMALRAQQGVRLNLITALDIAWQADGLQRDGPHVRGTVDILIRAALQNAKLSYSVVAGQGPTRLQAAIRSVEHALCTDARDATSVTEPSSTTRWRTWCECCADPECERMSMLARDR